MPTNRTRRIQPRRVEVGTSERTRHHLLFGHDFDIFDGPDLDADGLAAAWEELHEELLAAHIAEHPGTRPWAWWAFDAPESRRFLGDEPEDLSPFGVWYGMASSWGCAFYETEADYLDRLGLLTDAERAALNRPVTTKEGLCF